MFVLIKGLDRPHSENNPANSMVLVISFKNQPQMPIFFGKSAVDFPVMMGILSCMNKQRAKRPQMPSLLEHLRIITALES
jgi:hypothetical protein